MYWKVEPGRNKELKKSNLLNQTTTAQRCRSKTEKKLENLFSSVLSQLKKYHPSENLKFNNLGIFLSLKLRNSTVKTLRISLKLNLTPNTFWARD